MTLENNLEYQNTNANTINEYSSHQTSQEKVNSDITDENQVNQVDVNVSGAGIFLVFSIISFISSCVFFYKGYDKMSNYLNTDSKYSENINAYVGGDAYNYIINGTYSTSFFVLAIGFLLASILLILAYYISGIKNSSEFIALSNC